MNSRPSISQAVSHVSARKKTQARQTTWNVTNRRIQRLVAVSGLLFQPFVHVSGARYWPTAAPVAALGLAMLGSALLALRPGAVPARVGDAAPVRLFTVLQACRAVTVVAVWVALHVLAG